MVGNAHPTVIRYFPKEKKGFLQKSKSSIDTNVKTTLIFSRDSKFQLKFAKNKTYISTTSIKKTRGNLHLFDSTAPNPSLRILTFELGDRKQGVLLRNVRHQLK
ncbi:hypothetical protein NUACC26_059050 [Scytonema sp. NUACC26]